MAERNGAVDPKDVYFPVWRNRAAFDDPGDRTEKKIKRLSATDQAAIRDLRPYKGGNNYLAALHELDLTRKHRRLVTVFGAPEAVIFNNNTSGRDFQISPAWNGFEDNSIIATAAIHASERNLTLVLQICFAEPFIVSTKPLAEAIYDFAGMARTIINGFDERRGGQRETSPLPRSHPRGGPAWGLG